MSIHLHEVEIYAPAGHEDTIKCEQKKWGMEYIYPTEFGYTAKVMKVLPGSRCSTHLHRSKSESFLLIEGQLNVTFYEQDGTKREVILINPLDAVVLPYCTPHTFSVPIDQKHPTIFIEASTTDSPGDSYRLDKSQGPGE